MLTQDTKKHIDAARQILVGVVPNPMSQVEQITNALIYKFMDDMDQQSIKAGGEPAFFVKDLERYAWTKVMDSRLGNQERMNLYTEALIKFSEAKQLPQLFRDIFKQAFLPYRDPEVLGLFLKEISYFDYTHSEELGNAYEYLLSIMSSQGDAGQFRTPRHIIDFIVDVLAPTKDDTILDPACGTAGFLISAYNYIKRQNEGVDPETGRMRQLTADERRKLVNNFEGYDVDPTMVRMSQVNMYLHKFTTPKIYNYNTLASEDRWNDKFDLILANPPFMSPKGGIKPHNKFSIQANRAEVLFVDYITNHLKPKGRAGIIVPEGIIFQSGKAYKELRKNLVNDGLFAVVSLPAGVFNPYSGVKTSILFFDNEVAKKTKDLLFVKVTSDGYNLGAQRRKIEKDDLGDAGVILKGFREYVRTDQNKETIESFISGSGKGFIVSKEKIAESGEYNLSVDRYGIKEDFSNVKYPLVEVGEICELGRGRVISKIDMEKNPGTYPVYSSQTSNDGIFGYLGTYDFDGEYVTWTTDGANAGTVFYRMGKFNCTNVCGTLKSKSEKVNMHYLARVLNNVAYKYVIQVGNPKLMNNVMAKIKIPLPPLDVQKEIVEQIEVLQSTIEGANKVTESWKPVFVQDQKWVMKKLFDVADFQEGPGIMAVDFKKNGTPLIRLKGLSDRFVTLEGCNYLDPQKVESKWSHFKLNAGDLLLSTSGSLGRVSEVGSDLIGAIAYTGIIRFQTKSKELDRGFLKYFLMSNYFRKQTESAMTGVTLKHFGPTHLKEMEIMIPPLEIQKAIVEKIEVELSYVEAAKKLTEVIEKKIEEVLSEI
jgi:type I restriction enzyme M protein